MLGNDQVKNPDYPLIVPIMVPTKINAIIGIKKIDGLS